MAVYTLFGQSGSGAGAGADTHYTMGMEFSLSQSAPLTGIWFYSPAAATALPTVCAIYAVTGTSVVSGSQNNSPSWSGAAGSGWVKCAYASGPTLAASTNYKVVVFIPAGTNVYSFTTSYWSTGAGSSGLTSGIITAPNNAGGDGGQDTFNSGAALTYPATSSSATNYWVDVEVTTSAAATVAGPPFGAALLLAADTSHLTR